MADLETILFSNAIDADSFLKAAKFKLADKETGTGYNNYYYTSYEKKDSNLILLRTVSFMDVYSEKDTSRLVLYRTYNKNDQEEMQKQLIENGYELSRRSGNEFFYNKGNYTVVNKISEKQLKGNKPVITYEFEMGR